MKKSDRLEKVEKFTIKNDEIYIESQNYIDLPCASFLLIELKEKKYINFKYKKAKFLAFYFYKKDTDTKINLFLDCIFHYYVNLEDMEIELEEIENIFIVWY